MKNSFKPVSPYVSKLFGYWITICYRESYGLFACNEFYLTMKDQEEVKLLLLEISRAAAEISTNKRKCLYWKFRCEKRLYMLKIMLKVCGL